MRSRLLIARLLAATAILALVPAPMLHAGSTLVHHCSGEFCLCTEICRMDHARSHPSGRSAGRDDGHSGPGHEVSVHPAVDDDASGRVASGRDASGHDASGHDASGRDASGHDASGHDASGHDGTRVGAGHQGRGGDAGVSAALEDCQAVPACSMGTPPPAVAPAVQGLAVLTPGVRIVVSGSSSRPIRLRRAALPATTARPDPPPPRA